MIEYSGLEYHCAANDSFDSVALEVYGSILYTPDLMIANPKYCGMTVFNGGEVLRLPNLKSPSKSESTPPWKT